MVPSWASLAGGCSTVLPNELFGGCRRGRPRSWRSSSWQSLPFIPSPLLSLSTNRQLGSAVVTTDDTGGVGAGLPNDGEFGTVPSPLTNTESLVKTGPKR